MKHIWLISMALIILNSCKQTLSNCESTFSSQDVAYLIDNDSIKGTILIPKTEYKSVVLIIAGSGPTDRNGNQPTMHNNSLKMLAEGLADVGIASLRYDKRCIGKSKYTVSEEDIRFADFVNDATALLKILKTDKRFSRVYVAGHSEGSLIAILAAQKEQVSGLISIAGVGKSADLVLLDQLANIPEKLFNEAKVVIENLKKGNLIEKFDVQLTALFRSSVQPYLISWFKYNPVKEISQLDCPVLIIQGTTDIQVGVEHAHLLHQANDNSKLKIIEGMNHILKDAEPDRTKNMGTYLNPELPIKTEIIDIVAEFINN